MQINREKLIENLNNRIFFDGETGGVCIGVA